MPAPPAAELGAAQRTWCSMMGLLMREVRPDHSSTVPDGDESVGDDRDSIRSAGSAVMVASIALAWGEWALAWRAPNGMAANLFLTAQGPCYRVCSAPRHRLWVMDRSAALGGSAVPES